MHESSPPTHLTQFPPLSMRACTVKLNGNRTINGTLRGFDQFMNLVLDETMEVVSAAHHGPLLYTRTCHQMQAEFPCDDRVQVSASEQNAIGMVVIRGNSIVMIEALEKLWD